MKNSSLLALGLIAALGVAGLVSTPVLAGPGRPFKHRAPAPVHPSERLGLTPAQRAQILAILQAEKDTITALVAELREARKALRAAIRAQDATEESVRLASAVVAEVESDIAVERSKIYQQIGPILTQEQKDQIAEAEARIDEFLADVIVRIVRIGQRLVE